MNKNLRLLFIIILFISACKDRTPEAPVVVNYKKEIIAADIAFAEMSKKEGMRAAFLEYIDSNGVLLRPGKQPLVGGYAIDFISQQDDAGFTMEWQPEDGFVAKSGDLGYTYGVYKLTYKDTDSSKYGTYVSIWKKQPDGKWKFALDTGNEGIGLENNNSK